MSSGPTRRSPLAFVLAASVSVLAGCSDDDAASVDSLAVVDIQELDLPFSDAYLSPNGERIATYADEELCVFTSEGEEEHGTDEVAAIDSNSIQWDSDGSHLAFTENFYQYFHEPDIWSLDADSGELTNLTDDGVEESGLDMESEGADIDLSPEWMDDSTIRFLRWHREEDEEETVEILEVSTDGGDPEPVGTLATPAAPGTIAYSPDGEHAAYIRYEEEDLVVADLAGEHVTTVADGTTFAVSFSSDGESVLATSLQTAYDPSDAPPAMVVPADGGDATELDESVYWAAWRAEGDGLFLAQQVGPGADPAEMSLRLTDDAGDEGREVTTGPFLMPYRQASWRLPVWSTQDTILLMRRSEEASSGFEYVLVHLGEE